MRKSRVLSLLLTVIFVLANVTIPAFAETTYTYGDPANIIGLGPIVAPIDGLPMHISYKVDGDATYALSSTPAGISLSDDGIMTITSAAAPLGTNTLSATVNLKVNTTTSEGTATSANIAKVNSSFNFPFDDGVLPINTYNGGQTDVSKYRSPMNNVAIASDASGRIYGNRTSSNGYSNLHGQVVFFSRTTSAPFILELDMYNYKAGYDLNLYNTDSYKTMLYKNAPKSYTIDTDWLDYVVNSGATLNPKFDIANFSTYNQWHSFKWVIDPASKVVDDEIVKLPSYDLYIDGVNLLKNVTLYGPTANGSYLSGNSTNGVYQYYVYADRFDNYKRYGTSLGFAHDVEVGSNGKSVGSTLTATAELAHSPYYNGIPESLEYAFFISDTEDGEYSLLSEGASYTITKADEGKYIKAAARVVEAPIHEDPCKTDWVLSAKTLEVDVTPASWDILPHEEYTYGWIPSPLPGEVYELAYSVKDGHASDILSFTNHVNLGGTVTTASYLNGKGMIVTVNPNTMDYVASQRYAVSVNYPGGTKKSFTVSAPKGEDFENYDSATSIVGGGPAIKSDASGRTYAVASDARISVSASTMLGGTSPDNQRGLGGIVVIDYDANLSKTFTTEFILHNLRSISMTNRGAAEGCIRALDDMKDVYVGTGWKHVRMFFDFTNAKYSLFVGDVAVTVNQTLEPNSTYPTTRNGIRNIYFSKGGEIDNITISRATIKTPVAYNPVIANAAVGKALKADFDFFCGATDYVGAPTEVEYFISDDASSWTSVGSSYTPSADDEGKYVKAAITPKADYYFGQVLTGATVETAPALISKVQIGSVTVKANGEVCDLDKINFANTKIAVTDVTVEIEAASQVGENVKFIFANYNKYGSKDLLLSADAVDATLTEDMQKYSLTVSTVKNNGYTNLKVFMLTSEGLVPVMDAVNFK